MLKIVFTLDELNTLLDLLSAEDDPAFVSAPERTLIEVLTKLKDGHSQSVEFYIE